jgi:hypothetical protein
VATSLVAEGFTVLIVAWVDQLLQPIETDRAAIGIAGQQIGKPCESSAEQALASLFG